MTNLPLTDHITIDDLTDDMKLIADSCGIEVARSLIANCPGLQIYIPRPEHMKGLVQKYMMERYSGKRISEREIKELSVELKKSPSFLRNVVRGMG